MFTQFRNNLLVVISIGLFTFNSFAQEQKDIVNGRLIQFNDNGLWCWFQDERAVVDTNDEKMIIGSVANQTGVGFSQRNGDIEAVLFDLNNFIPGKYELAQMSADDHNAPGIIIRPDGKYLAMYSDHYDRYKNRYKIYNGSSWSNEFAYDWQQKPGGTNYTIAYNNIYYLSDEDRMYNFTRANTRSPNFIISDDWGDTWTFGAQLTTNSSNSYNKGYYKYWGNGVDRIDYIFTEQHPRDTLTSIYHGYIKGGKAYDSFDNLVDDDIYDESVLPTFKDYTMVFQNGTSIGNNTFYRCWQADLMRYDDGSIAAIITARQNQFISYGYPDNNVNPEHAFIYCRFDGEEWSYSYLGKAGLKFYASEADYVGLGALDPSDPTTLFISTPWDPRDTTINFGVREIFKGVTSDEGKTWEWSPITENSSRDNIRPIIPLWNQDHVAILWCRGTYNSAHSYDAAIVGIIENKKETIGQKVYVDASSANTTFAGGSQLTYTGPSNTYGEADNKWHLRTGVGNDGNVITSSDKPPHAGRMNGEDAPVIKTNIVLPDDGTYDIWVNFWGDPLSEWRIVAGLNEDQMQIYRSMASRQVNKDEYINIPIHKENNIFLYEAYAGRVSGVESIDIYIDDWAYRVGTSSPMLEGDVNRTWYDGITYAKVDGLTDFETEQTLAISFTLSQNYPNPFNPTTKISYNLPETGNVKIKIFDSIGREVAKLIDQYQSNGNHIVDFNADKYSSGVYFYRIEFNNRSITKKMMLIK